MSHYNVNAGVPKTLVQHLIRWVAETDQFDAETNELLEEILEQEITPELIPRDGRREAAGHRGLGRPLLAPGLHPLPRPPLRRPAVQDRVPGLARLARRVGGGVAARLPGRAAYVLRPRRRSVSGWRSSSSGSSPASSSAPRSPTAPRSAPAAPCPPAATGGCRPTPTPRPGWPSWRTCPSSRRLARLGLPQVQGQQLQLRYPIWGTPVSSLTLDCHGGSPCPPTSPDLVAP